MDLDNNKVVDIDEFISTIIHYGLGASNKVGLRNIANYQLMNINNIKLSHFKGYMTNPQLYYDHQFNYLITLSDYLFAICSSKTGKIVRSISMKSYGLFLSYQLTTIQIKQAKVLLLIATTSNSLLLFKADNNLLHPSFILCDKKSCNITNLCLTISHTHAKIYTGDIHGNIKIYQIYSIYQKLNDTYDIKLSKIINQISMNHDSITDIILLDQDDASHIMIITCSLDCLISLVIYNTTLNKFKINTLQSLKKSHKNGIIKIIYSSTYRYLISASIDHSICIWSLSTFLLLDTLIGHTYPIIDIYINNEIISIDDGGYIKIWNAENFIMIQTLSIHQSIINATYISRAQQILILDKLYHLSIYNQEGNLYIKDSELHENIQYILYNSTYSNFCVIGLKIIKLYDALSGALLTMFRNYSDYDITAIDLDINHKVIVADSKGMIRIYNYATGSFIKKLNGHNHHEINFIYYDVDKNVIISSSINQHIKNNMIIIKLMMKIWIIIRLM